MNDSTANSRDSTAEQDPKLLNLPAELRNRIYELTYAGTAVEDTSQIPGLLLACKKTHFEARGIYYRETTFIFDRQNTLCEWVLRLPEKTRKQLRHVRMDSMRHYRYAEYAEMLAATQLDSIIRKTGLKKKVVKASFYGTDGEIVWSSKPGEY